MARLTWLTKADAKLVRFHVRFTVYNADRTESRDDFLETEGAERYSGCISGKSPLT